MSISYEDRICCFIDILGFREHIKASCQEGRENLSKLHSIFNILNEANDLVKENKENEFKLSKQVTQFSDSIVISFKVDEGSEIPMTLINILHLCIAGITSGYLFRGGISYGKLFHNSEYLFGPAIVSAYDIENKAAIYPRIILDKTILDLAKQHVDHDHTPEEVDEFLSNVVTKDMDGMYYVDYINKADSEFLNHEIELKLYLNKLIELIALNSTSNSYDIRTKYGWLKTKTNALLQRVISDKESIEKLKLTNPDLAKYYEGLKIIE
ncbi:MAG: hypothetical protein ACTHMC_18530 [Pseudobacter sp.]|uniref:hypothetical protein n=1 Tax=Pseudobacter sp. TaxID=2045420 RepID=UPI003F814E30